MAFESADWPMTLILLVALVMVRSFEKQIKSVSLHSYQRIAGGLTILTLTSVARVQHAAGLMDSLPFLSETVFFDLVYWIAVITGSTLLISGVTDWLPLARDYRRYNRRRIEHLDLLRKVEQLVGVESRVETVMATTLQYIINQTEYSAGAVLKCSVTRRLMTLEAVAGEFPADRESLGRIDLDLEIADGGHTLEPNLTPLLDQLAPGLGRPQLTLPISVRQKPVGFILLWGDPANQIEPDDLRTLRLVADVVARMIDHERLNLQNTTKTKWYAWRDRLETAIDRVEETRERLALLAGSLGEQVSAEQVALIVPGDHGRAARRYSWGSGGRILVETNLTWPPAGSSVKQAIDKGRVVAYHNLDDADQPETTEIITGEPVRSLMVVPYLRSERLVAILVLASRQPAAFSPRIQRQLSSLGSLVHTVIWPDAVRAVRTEEIDRWRRLRRLTSGPVDNSQESSFIERAAVAISDETNADLVRISTLDATGSFLESRALVAASPQGEVVPANGQMIVSLMPMHLLAMSSGQIMALDATTNDAAMSTIERRQALTEGVRSVLVVPLRRDQRTIGVVSIGLTTEVTFESNSQTFIGAIADLLAAQIETAPVALPKRASEKLSIPAADTAWRTRSQLPSSVTRFIESSRASEELVEL